MGKSRIALKNADGYEAQLRDEGMVLADFGARRSEIERQLQHKAKQSKASLGETGSLLDEVTALVEHPTVYVGQFDPAYLAVPQECLILTMRQNQKYFPLFDAAGKLLPRFLIVSNMQLADPRHIVGGNERVVRPRLEDARFFYDQDRKQRLEERVPQLAKVVFHHKLGSQLDRRNAPDLADMVACLYVNRPADALPNSPSAPRSFQGRPAHRHGRRVPGAAGRDGALLRGARRRAGGGGARHRGALSPALCRGRAARRPGRLRGRARRQAVPAGGLLRHRTSAHRREGSVRPASRGARRDPHPGGARLPGALNDLVSAAYRALPKDIGQAHTDVELFVFERLRGYLVERGYAASEVEAVLSRAFVRLDQVPRQLDAVRAFAKLPEAPSLAAANKRIANILKQAEGIPPEYDAALFALAEEHALAETFAALQPEFESAFKAGDYTGALKALAALKAPVDAFFDKVLVMDKDEGVRRNRIGFLGKLHATMNRIADLSKLAA
jgi:glycyl-tRNA synthetase beta chain